MGCKKNYMFLKKVICMEATTMSLLLKYQEYAILSIK